MLDLSSQAPKMPLAVHLQYPSFPKSAGHGVSSDRPRDCGKRQENHEDRSEEIWKIISLLTEKFDSLDVSGLVRELSIQESVHSVFGHLRSDYSRTDGKHISVIVLPGQFCGQMIMAKSTSDSFVSIGSD